MKTILFILNPISGTVSKRNIAELIERCIDRERYDCTIRYTEYAGHAEEIARQAAAEGIDVVVAVGGDGTVNEVARGIVQTETALAIIPCGSGNGLARHLMLPMSPQKAIKVINEMSIHRLDYGVIDKHVFLCTCGMGFDAFIADRFAKAGKRGIMTYVEKMFTDGLAYETEKYTYTIDDNAPVTQEAWLISCANASQYGNNAYIAPQASMRDGVMDIVVMEPFNLLNAVSVSLEMLNKTLNKNSRTHNFKAKRLLVEREKAGIIHFDGEPAMASAKVEINLIEQGINVVVNANADKRKRRPNPLQLALSDFFYDVDTFQKKVIETGKSIQQDTLETIETGKSIQQDIIKTIEETGKSIQQDIIKTIGETGKSIQQDILERGKTIHKKNQELLNKLTGNK